MLAGCGVQLTRASIRIIDRRFVLQNPGGIRGLFIDKTTDDVVRSLMASHCAIVAAANKTMAGEEPNIPIGEHCTHPFACSFFSWCRRDLPLAPQWPVGLLRGITGKAVAQRLVDQGVEDLLDAEPSDLPAPLLRRVRTATVSGIGCHDADAIHASTAG